MSPQLIAWARRKAHLHREGSNCIKELNLNRNESSTGSGRHKAKEYQLQQEEAQSGQFQLGPFCNQAAQAASADFSGKGPKAGSQGGPK